MIGRAIERAIEIARRQGGGRPFGRSVRGVRGVRGERGEVGVEMMRRIKMMRNEWKQCGAERSKRSAGARWGVVLCVLTVWAWVWTAASPAGAQLTPSDLYSTYRISLSKEDLAMLIDRVVDDEAEAPEPDVIRSLYEGYRRKWSAEASRTRSDIKRIRSEGRDRGSQHFREEVQPRIQARQEEWAEYARRLESQFFDDVKAVLTEEQAARFPRFQRDRRRQRLLRRYSRLSGEGVDLIELVDDVKIPAEARQAIEPLLHDYAEELDRALIDRQRTYEDVQRTLNAINAGESNASAASLFHRILPRRKAIRGINERYATLIADQLPEEWAERFTREFDRVRYPRLHAVTQADQYLKRVRELEDLTEEQQQRIDLLETNYRGQLEPINRRLIELDRRRDEEMPARYRMADIRREMDVTEEEIETMSGERQAELEIAVDSAGGSSETRDEERRLWEERRALEKQLIEDVHAVLNEDQKERAPIADRIPQPGGRPQGAHERPDHNEDGG